MLPQWMPLQFGHNVYKTSVIMVCLYTGSDVRAANSVERGGVDAVGWEVQSCSDARREVECWQHCSYENYELSQSQVHTQSTLVIQHDSVSRLDWLKCCCCLEWFCATTSLKTPSTRLKKATTPKSSECLSSSKTHSMTSRLLVRHRLIINLPQLPVSATVWKQQCLVHFHPIAFMQV